MIEKALPEVPTLPDIQDILYAAMRSHQDGDFYEADLLYAQMLHVAPDNVQAFRLRGILARERGELKKSLHLLQRASELAPANPEPLGEIALVHMAAGNLQEAELILRRALALDPTAVKTLTNLGALLQYRGHIQAAIDCYQQALAINHDDIEVRCNLAKALVDAGQTEQALVECKTAVKKTDRHPFALATLGAVLTDSQQYAEARATLEQATTLEPGDDIALVNLGLSCYGLGDLAAATSALGKAVTTNPYNARAVADLANCLTASGDVDAALELCHGFLQQNPGERLVIGALALALHNSDQQSEANELTNCATLVRVFELPCPDNYANLEEFNHTLAEQIQNDSSLLTSPTSKATAGGDQTGELNLADGDFAELGRFFNQAIGDAANSYIAAGLADHPLMEPAAKDWSLRAWGTLLRAGGKQISHMHPLGWLSGIYYLSLPDNMDETEDEAGWLEFGQPPERFFRTSEPETYRYKPVEGKLILFPSWFWHQTVPFSADQNRISIAFDVMPKSTLRIL